MPPLHRAKPRIVTSLPGPNAAQWIARDSRVISPSYTPMYPLVVRRASGCIVEDVDGNRFLDMTAGIAVTSVGHSHPAVVKAIRRQAGRLIHMSGTDFHYEPQIELAERLAELAPGDGPKRVFFANSGTESVEAALKLARRHTGRQNVIAFFGSFHGRTYGSMSLSASKPLQREGFGPLVPGIYHAQYGNLESVRTLLPHTCPPHELAAIFVEPIQGEGGYIVPPDDFLAGLRAICDEHGALLVFDEVQSGIGRTGKMFASEHWNVVPDITCLAKGIADGMPLGAIVAHAHVMDWPRGSHASTFGGNPVSCAAALETLRLVETRYMERAQERGEQLVAGLHKLATEFELIKEVRGKGLMIGMEIQRDGKPAPQLRDAIVQAAFEHGMLILPCGPSTIRFCPPLCLRRGQVRLAVALLRKVILQLESQAQRVDAV